MKKFEDYMGYGLAFAKHPLRFYASVVQANAQIGKQYLDAYKHIVDLGEKELETIAESDSVGDYFNKQKDIFDEAVSSTSHALKDSLDTWRNAQRPMETLVSQTLEERETKRRTRPKAAA